MKLSPILLLLFIIFSSLGTFALADLPSWSHDAGPCLESDLGLELVDLTATIPNMPEVSTAWAFKQKTDLKDNSLIEVEILIKKLLQG